MRSGRPTLLRAGHRLSPGAPLLLQGLRDAMQFEAVLQVHATAGRVALELWNRHGERHVIGIDLHRRVLFSDRTRVRTPPGFCCSKARGAPCHCFDQVTTSALEEVGGDVRLHFFVDASSVELFVDHGVAVMTETVYPSRRFTHARLLGDASTLLTGTVYDLAWPQAEAERWENRSHAACASSSTVGEGRNVRHAALGALGTT